MKRKINLNMIQFNKTFLVCSMWRFECRRRKDVTTSDVSFRSHSRFWGWARWTSLSPLCSPCARRPWRRTTLREGCWCSSSCPSSWKIGTDTTDNRHSQNSGFSVGTLPWKNWQIKYLIATQTSKDWKF